MKVFTTPVVLEIEELAEGVYAASGAIDNGMPEDPGFGEATTDCWTISINRDQQDAGGYSTWRIDCRHNNSAEHISSSTRIFVNFNGPVTAAEFEGFSVEVSGNIVYLTRQSHANAYQSGDHYNSLLKIWADNYQNISLINYGIECTHQTNVHGIFD